MFGQFLRFCGSIWRSLFGTTGSGSTVFVIGDNSRISIVTYETREEPEDRHRLTREGNSKSSGIRYKQSR
jgi:hypothetical protein